MSEQTQHSGQDLAEPGPARTTREELLEHEYDGIREFDNPTPGWWHAMFLGTVVFSVLYVSWVSLSPVAKTPEERWERTQVAQYKKIFGGIGTLAGDAPTLTKLMGDEKLMAVASGMFQSNCASCHGRDGGGINGVNLTDDHFKNVRSIEDLLAVINNGAAAGAMPAWKDRMGGNERVLLAAYAASLRGTKPAAGKAAEGEVIAPWPKPGAGAGAGTGAGAGAGASAAGIATGQ